MRRGIEAPIDPAAALQAMIVCRDAMIDICQQVKPMGVMYQVIEAINALACILTGQSEISTSAEADQPQQRQRVGNQGLAQKSKVRPHWI